MIAISCQVYLHYAAGAVSGSVYLVIVVVVPSLALQLRSWARLSWCRFSSVSNVCHGVSILSCGSLIARRAGISGLSIPLPMRVQNCQITAKPLLGVLSCSSRDRLFIGVDNVG